jgi:hypothetical protein
MGNVLPMLHIVATAWAAKAAHPTENFPLFAKKD